MKSAILLLSVAAASTFVGALGMYVFAERSKNEVALVGVSDREKIYGAQVSIADSKNSMMRGADGKEDLRLTIDKLVESQLMQNRNIEQILDRLNKLEQEGPSIAVSSDSVEYVSEEELVAQAEAQRIAAQNSFYDNELDMATQPLDSPWATEMRSALEKMKENKVTDQVGIKVVDSECRSKTCRVEFGVQGAAAVNPEVLIPLVTTLPHSNMKMMKIDGGTEPRYVALFEKADE